MGELNRAGLNRVSLVTVAAGDRNGAGLLVLALSGCAFFNKPPAPSAAAMAGAAPADYLIGPGDAVNIIVWRNPEVSMSVPVRPDGKITTPLVEDLPVGASALSGRGLALVDALTDRWGTRPVATGGPCLSKKVRAKLATQISVAALEAE